MDKKQQHINNIPIGGYCYKHSGKLSKNGIFPERIYCPFFTFKEVNSVKIPYCEFLDYGSIPANLSEEESKLLGSIWGYEHPVVESKDDSSRWLLRLPQNYHFDSLLWDAVKECGINDPPDLYEN